MSSGQWWSQALIGNFCWSGQHNSDGQCGTITGPKLTASEVDWTDSNAVKEYSLKLRILHENYQASGILTNKFLSCTKHPYLFPRARHSSCSTGNTIWVFGGSVGSSEKHNLQNDLWRIEYSARGRGTLECFGPLLRTPKSEANSNEAQNVSWPCPRAGATLVAVTKHLLLLFGGVARGEGGAENDLHALRYLADLWLFDTAKRKWKCIGGGSSTSEGGRDHWPVGRSGHTLLGPMKQRITPGAPSEGPLLFILYGGITKSLDDPPPTAHRRYHDGSVYLGDTWELNFTEKKWTMLDGGEPYIEQDQEKDTEKCAIRPSPRTLHAAALCGQKMYLCGGNGSPGKDALWVFDCENRLWSKLFARENHETLLHRQWHTMVSIGDKLIITGGIVPEGGAYIPNCVVIDVATFKILSLERDLELFGVRSHQCVIVQQSDSTWAAVIVGGWRERAWSIMLGPGSDHDIFSLQGGPLPSVAVRKAESSNITFLNRHGAFTLHSHCPEGTIHSSNPNSISQQDAQDSLTNTYDACLEESSFTIPPPAALGEINSDGSLSLSQKLEWLFIELGLSFNTSLVVLCRNGDEALEQVSEFVNLNWKYAILPSAFYGTVSPYLT